MNQILFILLLLVSIFKFLLFVVHNELVHVAFYGGDAAFYHNSVIYSYHAITSWVTFLQWLDGNGVYNRHFITVVIQVLSVFVIPFQSYALVFKITNDTRQALYAALGLALYTSLFIYSGDIYRDIVMVFMFLSLLNLTVMFSSLHGVFKIVCFVLIVLLFFLITMLRGYLGLALIISFFAAYINFRLRPYVFFFFYCFSILLLHQSGLLEPFYAYRSSFLVDTSTSNNTTLGIDLSNASIVTILPLFFQSYLVQFFGFYFSSVSGVVVFILESVPIIYMLRRIVFSDRSSFFFRYCVYFVLIYNTVWVLANDNFGTATRLRMYSYLVILFLYLSTFSVKDKQS